MHFAGVSSESVVLYNIIVSFFLCGLFSLLYWQAFTAADSPDNLAIGAGLGASIPCMQSYRGKEKNKELEEERQNAVQGSFFSFFEVTFLSGYIVDISNYKK